MKRVAGIVLMLVFSALMALGLVLRGQPWPMVAFMAGGIALTGIASVWLSRQLLEMVK